LSALPKKGVFSDFWRTKLSEKMAGSLTSAQQFSVITAQPAATIAFSFI
jgi:hypothetical protein